MGFLDFFKSIFGGTKCQFQPEELDINVTDNAIIVNGNSIEFPCMLDDIAKLFGKPSRTSDPKTNVIYTWDKLGIICYAKAGSKVVFCISLLTRPEDGPDTYPRSPYIGRLLINGENWEKVMYGGEDEEGFARSLEFDNFDLIAEYSDIDECDEDGCEDAYTGLEISLKGI